MPRVEQAATPVAGATPYGVTQNDNTKTFQERMMERFAAQDFVEVKNITGETITWQYLPAHEEDFEFTRDPMKITRRGRPEVWEIAPGGTEVLVGSNAYLMLDATYKAYAATETLAQDVPEAMKNQARNFNYSDPGRQEAFLDAACLGKAQPQFGVPAPQVEPTATEPAKVETGVGGSSK